MKDNRIQELAEQEGLLGPSSRVGNAHEAAEKFAELIIAECAKACEPAAQKKPQNCGSGFCSCIECVMEPAQEPVGEVQRYGLDSHGRQWHGIHWYNSNVDVPHRTKLYTSPTRQEWVGLTDDERAECWSSSAKQSAINIEAKLKEKNT